MYLVFHKSVLSDGVVLNLITGSKNFGTLNFSKLEAQVFISRKNKQAVLSNLTIRYFKLKSVNSKVAA